MAICKEWATTVKDWKPIQNLKKKWQSYTVPCK